MVLSIAEPQHHEAADGSTRYEVLSPEMLKLCRFEFRSWGQPLERYPAPEGEVVVCLTLDIGPQDQVHVTCSDAAALELLEPKYRRFKVRLIPNEGLAITAVESRHYPDGLIPCRRDAV